MLVLKLDLYKVMKLLFQSGFVMRIKCAVNAELFCTSLLRCYVVCFKCFSVLSVVLSVIG